MTVLTNVTDVRYTPPGRSINIPACLTEIKTLGRALNHRKDDILAYFIRPGTSNGSAEAINGRLEHLCGIALEFSNLANYTLRCLLDSRGFTPPSTNYL